MRNYLENKQFLILIITCLLTFLYFIYILKPVGSMIKPFYRYNIKTKIEKFDNEKRDLQIKISEEKKRNLNLLSIVDSFEKIKPKIKIKYVTKFKEIDTSHIGTLSKEFDSIFSAHNIK